MLVITSGGRRVIDRDPESAGGNCLGWTYGASPALDERGELVGMYVVSDALTQHCSADVGIDSTLRFGDAIRFHALHADGSWSEGANVIDRTSFDWMNDSAFINANLQTYAGHVASPSVVRRDGRWFMAFVVSRDDRNLCAGEHYAGNACGSCLDPWSYFVVAWAVSDDGVTWRIREQTAGDPTFIGRPPNDVERVPPSSYKGLTRVSMLSEGGYFYIAAQYWARTTLKVAMFRVPYDAQSEWGTSGEAEAWSTRRHAWVTTADYLDAANETSIFSFSLGSIVRTRDGFLALSTASNQIYYQTSSNLVDWTWITPLRSSIPFFADGFGYQTSVIDPVAFEGADGKLHLFFASADGDVDHGVGRDGRHDCGIYSEFGPTAVYLGTGIYDAVVERRALRATLTTLQPRAGRLEVRVTALDGTTPAGNVVVADTNGAFRIAPLAGGVATVDLPSTTVGQHQLYAFFDAQGEWDASRSVFVAQRITIPPRRRATR